MITQLRYDMKDRLSIFETTPNLSNYTNLINYSLFFMLLLINLNTKKNFLEMLFEKDSKLIKILISYIKSSCKNYQNSNKIARIYCNLFFDEYKNMFFLNEIEDLFILNNEKFTKVNTEGLDIYPKNVYINILETIKNLDFTYDFLSNKNIIQDQDDKPLGKN
jgi:hypothetical protein